MDSTKMDASKNKPLTVTTSVTNTQRRSATHEPKPQEVRQAVHPPEAHNFAVGSGSQTSTSPQIRGKLENPTELTANKAHRQSDEQPSKRTKDKIKYVHRSEPDPTPKAGSTDTIGEVEEALSIRSSVISLQEHIRHQQTHLDNVHDPEQTLSSLGLADVGEVYDADLLNELVLYDKLGNPYVDIFKLMFNHQKIRKQKKPHELTFSNYAPDFIFLMGKLSTLIISALTLLIGYSIVTYINSVKSTFSHMIPDLQTKSNKRTQTPVAIINFRYFNKRLRTSLESKLGVVITGYIIIVSAIVNVVNSVLGLYASVQLYPKLLITHNAVNIAIIAVNLFVSFSNPVCDTNEALKFGNRIISYIQTYTMQFDDDNHKEPAQFAAMQLDEIQISLDCCGAYSWLDYLDDGVIGQFEKSATEGDESDDQQATRDRQTRRELSNIELVFPASCCKPWWIKNIHCAVGMHKYAHPAATPRETLMFRDRISQKGCVHAVLDVCNRTADLTTTFLRIMCGIHFIFFVLECISLHVIGLRVAKLVREKLHAAKREAAEQTGEGFSDTSLTLELPADNKDAKNSDIKVTTKNVPLPTEDQIQLIKSRSDFNKFEATMANTHVGEWISAARRAVFKANRKTNIGQAVELDVSKLTISRSSISKKNN